jgi:hypothetical protein
LLAHTIHALPFPLLKSIHPRSNTITQLQQPQPHPFNLFPSVLELQTTPQSRCLEVNQVASPALERVPNRESYSVVIVKLQKRFTSTRPTQFEAQSASFNLEFDLTSS